jgi:hypothetical protein
LQRFYATMISKKFFSWWVVTGFFVADHFYCESGRDWIIEYLAFTSAVFCIDVAQKYAGLKGKA